MNYQDFISKEKSLLIAPAGYGKTHALAECLYYTPENEKQLILTHTHAGIASIKEKVRKLNISTSKYHIETITGFAQKYVLAFYCGNDIPMQEDSANYYPFIIRKASELFETEALRRTIQYSYRGLFVDEYQDCTKTQHKMITSLAEILPTHLLGDPMQGIFGFNEALVDFENDLNTFEAVDPLVTPWRWTTESNNIELGNTLKDIRTTLNSTSKIISLANYNSTIEYVNVVESEIYNSSSPYRIRLNELILNRTNQPDLKSFLLLVPEYIENNIPKGSIINRSELKSQIDYTNQLTLLEAIDNKDFYFISKKIDELVYGIGRKRMKLKAINTEVLCKIFNSGSLNDWIKEDSLIKKREPNIEIKNKLELKINAFFNAPSVLGFLHIILFMRNEMKFKTKRQNLLNSIIKSMKIAVSENKSVYESMISHKNIVRRVGSKIHGKCMGTTLLTKGLEFDTVVILNAHRFDNYKHFYVAITRACKRLIIFSESDTIQFS